MARSRFVVAVWSLVSPDDRRTYAGHVWTHEDGWDARVLRDGQLFVSVVCRTREKALEYLDLQRRVLSGRARE